MTVALLQGIRTRGDEIGMSLKMRYVVHADITENTFALIAGNPLDVAMGVANH